MDCIENLCANFKEDGKHSKHESKSHHVNKREEHDEEHNKKICNVKESKHKVVKDILLETCPDKVNLDLSFQGKRVLSPCRPRVVLQATNFKPNFIFPNEHSHDRRDGFSKVVDYLFEHHQKNHECEERFILSPKFQPCSLKNVIGGAYSPIDPLPAGTGTNLNTAPNFNGPYFSLYNGTTNTFSTISPSAVTDSRILILVHGSYGSINTNLTAAQAFYPNLQRWRFDNIYSYHWFGDDDFANVSAANLAFIIFNLPSNVTKITIWNHSRGGTLTRYALEVFGAGRRCRNVCFAAGTQNFPTPLVTAFAMIAVEALAPGTVNNANLTTTYSADNGFSEYVLFPGRSSLLRRLNDGRFSPFYESTRYATVVATEGRGNGNLGAPMAQLQTYGDLLQSFGRLLYPEMLTDTINSAWASSGLTTLDTRSKQFHENHSDSIYVIRMRHLEIRYAPTIGTGFNQQNPDTLFLLPKLNEAYDRIFTHNLEL